MPRYTYGSCGTGLARPASMIASYCPTREGPFQQQRAVERWDNEGGSLGPIEALTSRAAAMQAANDLSAQATAVPMEVG